MSAIGEEKKTTEFDSAMKALRRAESALPDFTSSYDGEIRRLYDEIVNRPAFRYDPSSDPLYQSYRTQYVTQGEQAMRDTMGQAAALTGGYGSSYAQGVGQQQYALYLERLGQVMPQLYKAAWERWNAGGDELYSRFNTTLALARDEAGRAKDRYDEAVRLEQQAYQREQDRLDRELALDQMQYQRQQADSAQALAWQKMTNDQNDKSYQKLTSLISQSGYSPSDAELNAAGMSRAQADSLRNSYLMKNPLAMVMSGSLPQILAATGGSGGSTGGGYTIPTGPSTDTRSSGSSTAGSKELLKLTANQKGSSSGGKQRRL